MRGQSFFSIQFQSLKRPANDVQGQRHSAGCGIALGQLREGGIRLLHDETTQLDHTVGIDPGLSTAAMRERLQ